LAAGVAVLATSAYLWSCGGSDAPAPSGNIADSQVLAELTRDTSEYQSAIFADGNITFDEYELATLDHIACLVDKGFIVGSGPTLNSERIFEFVIGSDLPPPESRPLSQACYEEYLDDVYRAWLFAGAVRADEQLLQLADSLLRQCLEDAGYPPPEGPQSLGSFAATVPRETLRPCTAMVEQETGLEGFLGR
jgi:hypothetical protein